MALWSRKTDKRVVRSLIEHPTLGSVTLNRTPRAKRISISVRASGEVRLTLPHNGRESEALRFLDAKVEWIVEARRRVATRREAAREAAAREGQTFNSEPLSKSDIELLRGRAQSYLPERVALLAERFGFKYGRVTIRIARTKWGSCTSLNNLSLSLFLMQLPTHLIDFVILHELCHTIHHNHSAKFYELLNRCTDGCERRLNQELRGYSCGV